MTTTSSRLFVSSHRAIWRSVAEGATIAHGWNFILSSELARASYCVTSARSSRRPLGRLPSWPLNCIALSLRVRALVCVVAIRFPARGLFLLDGLLLFLLHLGSLGGSRAKLAAASPPERPRRRHAHEAPVAPNGRRHLPVWRLGRAHQPPTVACVVRRCRCLSSSLLACALTLALTFTLSSRQSRARCSKSRSRPRVPAGALATRRPYGFIVGVGSFSAPFERTRGNASRQAGGWQMCRRSNLNDCQPVELHTKAKVRPEGGQ